MTGAVLKLWFDGGCRPNPGAIEVAVVARGVTYHHADFPPGTSNDAEWLALLHALGVARELGGYDIVLLGDSAVVIGQASGSAKCRSAALAGHYAAFIELAGAFARIRLRHVKRSHNLAGIALERRRAGL